MTVKGNQKALFNSLASGLDWEAAPASALLRLNRGHWEIDNQLHDVRDVSDDEDRYRVQAKRLRRHLACLANAVILIVRSTGDSTRCQRLTATSLLDRATRCERSPDTTSVAETTAPDTSAPPEQRPAPALTTQQPRIDGPASDDLPKSPTARHASGPHMDHLAAPQSTELDSPRFWNRLG